jgi:hypothetical protein
MSSFFDSPQFWELCDDAFDRLRNDEYINRLQVEILDYNMMMQNADRKIDFTYLNELNSGMA